MGGFHFLLLAGILYYSVMNMCFFVKVQLFRKHWPQNSRNTKKFFKWKLTSSTQGAPPPLTPESVLHRDHHGHPNQHHLYHQHWWHDLFQYHRQRCHQHHSIPIPIINNGTTDFLASKRHQAGTISAEADETPSMPSRSSDEVSENG